MEPTITTRRTFTQPWKSFFEDAGSLVIPRASFSTADLISPSSPGHLVPLRERNLLIPARDYPARQAPFQVGFSAISVAK